jgi:F-box-like
MASISIETLPNEVLQSVFAHVRNSGKLGCFNPCLRVCRRWNSNGIAIFWRTLVLQKEKMDKLITSALEHNHPFNFVSSLTLSLGAPIPSRCYCECHDGDDHDEYNMAEPRRNHQWRCNGDNSEIQDMEKAIQRLLVLVRHKMTNLTTFSMLIDPEPEEASGPSCSCYDTTFSEQFGSSILRSLPKTCVNLEIDTGGAEIGCCCSLLRELLKQLSQLRLRTRSLCWRFLSSSQPTTEDDSNEHDTQTQPLSATLRNVMISSVIYPRGKGPLILWEEDQSASGG